MPADRLAARAALAAGSAGLAYRVGLLIAGLPPTNSDEATMGLMARHILAGERVPAFFYGQHYMGALEAYLAVPVFAMFDSSTAGLRVATVAFYAAFLFAMYQLTRRLFSPWFAVAVVGLLAVGSDRVLKNQIIAGGGYPEMNALGAALLLGAVVLAQTERSRRGVSGYALLGLGAGLALWSDYLVAPYVAGAGAILVLFCRRRLTGWAGAALAGGALLGLAPVIAHDLTARPRDRSLAVLLDLSQAGHEQLGDGRVADHLHGAVLLGIPLATGYCPPGHCGPAQIWWGVAFVALLAVAAVLAVLGLRRADAADRPERIRHVAQLALVGAAVATIGAYAKSPAAVLTPIESSRYLSCLLVSLPVVLWPLWRAARGRRLLAVPAVALLVVVGFGSAAASAAAVNEVPRVRAAARAEQGLLDELDRLGAHHIYSEYWTCNRLTFATRERIVCAALADDLRPGLDRYRPYREVLAGSPDPVYVLPADSTVDRAFAAHLRRSAVDTVVREVDGYRIYLPSRPPGVPLP